MLMVKIRKMNRGFVLVTTALCIIGLLGALGLAVDLGRVFITKSELQVYVDSAALAATMELDGTSDGIARARAQAAANTNTWNLATTQVSGAQISFGKTPTGPWDANPIDPQGYLYANVTAQAPLPLYFWPAVATSSPQTSAFAGGPVPIALIAFSNTMNVSGASAAGQQLTTNFGEGLFPFSPFAQNNTAPTYGLTPGGMYTLRWAANPKLNQNVCPGDNSQAMIDLANAGGGSERGYYQLTSANAIRADIEFDQQDFTVTVGQSINMTGGAKQTELDALKVRIAQDTDSTSATYEDYIALGQGNGRRIVGVPLNNGYPTYTVVQIAAFFLPPASSYNSGGNSPWCAEYLGAWVEGAKNKGAADIGAYLVRLVK